MPSVISFYTIRFDEQGNGVQNFEYNYVPESLGALEFQCTAEQYANFDEYVLDSNRKIVRSPDRNLEGVRAKLKANFHRLCHERIVSGFISGALGSTHIYGCSIEDQLNLMRTAYVGSYAKIPCGLDGAWARRVHTYQQIQQLNQEMDAHIEQHRGRYAELVQQIDLCTKRAELNGLVW